METYSELMATVSVSRVIVFAVDSSHWTAFHEVWNLNIFRKSVEDIQVFLKCDKNEGTLREDLGTFKIVFRSFHLIKRTVSDKSCSESQNTHFIFSNFAS
jgi:hypothetical protein